MRFTISLLVFGLLLMPLGVAHANNGKGKGNGNANNNGVHTAGNGQSPNANSNSTKTNNSWRRVWAKGGIDPASFPVIDDDLLFAVIQTDWQIGRSKAHRYATGRGIRVAVLDGGFDADHPALMGRMEPGYNCITNDFYASDLGNGRDDDGDGVIDNAVGHGNFVAGQILWAAPDAIIVPICVRDDEGWGTTDELMRGLLVAMWMGVDVVNLSLSEEAANAHHILNILDMMKDQGIAIVVSAGNEGEDRISELAMRRTALAVSAVDRTGRLADFSNYSTFGDPLLICAPGVDLYGPMMHGASGYWSGTSFAAGIVSGGVALLKQRHPDWQPEQIFEHLRATATQARDEHGRPIQAGLINLMWAVR